MKGVTVKSVTVVRLTKSDWRLATDTKQYVIDALNQTVEWYFNQGLPRNVVEHEVLEVMKYNEAAGAMAPEPRAVLACVLDVLYKGERNEF